MIYIVIFFLSFLFCDIGVKQSQKGKTKSANILFCLAVLAVSIIAGIRDFTIGSDIKTYGHWMFLGALEADSLIEYLKSNIIIEAGYATFVYIIALFFTNEHWLYFFTGLFIYGFTLFGLKKYKNFLSLSWAWCSFLFLLYGDTLNAMRQCMALSVTLWAFPYVLDKRYKEYILWTLIACLFHNTAIISFGIFLIYWLLTKKDNFFVKTCIVLGITVSLILYNQVLKLFISLGILNGRFERYITSGFSFDSLNPILIRLPFFIVALFFIRSLIKKREFDSYDGKTLKIFVDFLLLISFVEMIVAEMRLVSTTLYRLTFYFTVYRCVMIGRMTKVLQKNNKIVIKSLFIVLLIVIWIYQNVLQGNNEIYPFTSEVIGLY